MKNSPSIAISYEIKNIGKTPRCFSFWFHNWFDFGGDNRLLLAGCAGSIEEQISSFPSAENLVFPVKNAPFTNGNEAFEKKNRRKEIAGGPFIMYSNTAKRAFVIKVQNDKVLQEYTHTSVTPTLELMFKPQSLKGGEVWKTSIEFEFKNKIEKDEITTLLKKSNL